MTVQCGWCDQPATTEVEIAPAETKSVAGVKKLIRRAHRWPACKEHSTFQRTPPPIAATAQARPRPDHRVRPPRRPVIA